jgi:hypothetical protein
MRLTIPGWIQCLFGWHDLEFQSQYKYRCRLCQKWGTPRRKNP